MRANDDFVNQLLDASLAAYSAEEPRAGLEQRVLARLADAPQPAAWFTWPWLPVGALSVAALLTLAFFLPHKEADTPAPPTIASQPSAVTPTPGTPAANAPAIVSKQPVRATSAASPMVASEALPRAPQFPRPGALTEEERHLMSYLNSAPREVLVAVARSNVGSNQPLADLLVRDVEVPRLELKPLPEQSGEAAEN